jgi:CubicO group peptidase (beta-lactamase class C family)
VQASSFTKTILMRSFAWYSMLVLLSVAFAVQAQKQPKNNRFAGMDTALNRVLKDAHAAGFAVAVVEKDKLIYAKGFGYKDYEKKLPVTTHTLFAIGSCSRKANWTLISPCKPIFPA